MSSPRVARGAYEAAEPKMSPGFVLLVSYRPLAITFFLSPHGRSIGPAQRLGRPLASPSLQRGPQEASKLRRQAKIGINAAAES